MSTLYKTNQNSISTQKELDEDIQKLLRKVASCNTLSVFIPGLTSLIYELNNDVAGETACTDGFTVFISEGYWNINTDEQKIGLLFHEMLHCLWLHMFRFLHANHMYANIACDIVINRFVKSLSRYSVYIALPANPPGGQIIFTDEYGDNSEEIIYNEIIQEEEEEGKGKGKDKGKSKGDGKGKWTKYKGPGDFTDPPPNPPTPEDEEDEEGSSKGKGKTPADVAKELKEKWEQTQQSISQTARLKGDFPGGLIEQLENTKTSIDWLAILQRFLLNTSSSDVSEELFDRRFLGEEMYIEAIDSPQVEDIVFAKDTSGSMEGLWLSQTCSEIQAAMQAVKIKRCWVLDIDAAMQGIIKEHGPNDQIDFSAKGRGGTDFRPPFDWAKKECPTTPKALIYFTDGWGPFPEEAPAYPVLWMTFGLEPEKYPFGTVIDMREIV
jgi:predicted metal-dependent peptidase